ncbi:hypothetical protein QW131_21275 [Roseibium salinum]|nr:hypothetical protein [Roseibium salinum]
MGYLAVLNETAGAVKNRLQEEMKFGGGPDFEKACPRHPCGPACRKRNSR